MYFSFGHTKSNYFSAARSAECCIRLLQRFAACKFVNLGCNFIRIFYKYLYILWSIRVSDISVCCMSAVLW